MYFYTPRVGRIKLTVIRPTNVVSTALFTFYALGLRRLMFTLRCCQITRWRRHPTENPTTLIF